MKFFKYFKKEKPIPTLLEVLDGKDIVEVSQEYYEIQKSTRGPAPVITEISEDGFVHQYHVFISKCDRCGKCFVFKDRKQLYYFGLGKNHCKSCHDEIEKERTTKCHSCGKEILYRNAYSGFCKDCWENELIRLRKHYQKYENMLREYLQKQGIELAPITTEGLDESGRPEFSVKDESYDILPLRDNEYAIYLFKVSGGVMALPNNRIGLRYIKPPLAAWIKEKAEHPRLLAAGSDGNDLFLLTINGEIISTNSDWEKRELFNLQAGCPEIVHQYFSEEEIQLAQENFCKERFITVDGSVSNLHQTFFDTSAKKFFVVYADGNYYHGYDTGSYQTSKEKVISSLIRFRFSLEDFINECEDGIIPKFFLICSLDEGKGEYEPPDGFADTVFSGI